MALGGRCVFLAGKPFSFRARSVLFDAKGNAPYVSLNFLGNIRQLSSTEFFLLRSFRLYRR